MKIAHISDLHLDKNHKKDNYKRTLQILEYIAANNFDHVIITGDITENAEAGAFKLARNMFKKYGLLNSKKLSLVIGNHDIYGGVHLAEDVINFPNKCKATDYEKKIEEFGTFFNEAFDNTIRPIKHNLYPFIKEFDNFVLIGLNSIAKYSVFKNPFASNGEISDKQLDVLTKILKENRFRNKHKIIITHHHFCKDVLEEENSSSALWQVIERQTMKLRSKKRIIKRFKKLGVDLVLHGHLHKTTAYHRKHIKFINAGGSVLGKNNELTINVINITKDEIKNEFVTIPFDGTSSSQPKGLNLPKIAYQKALLESEICLN